MFHLYNTLENGIMCRSCSKHSGVLKLVCCHLLFSMPYEIVTCVLLYVCAVDFSETLPMYCVPSFTGRLVRYTWKLSVGASRGLNADAKIIRIPFQVMTVPGGLVWRVSVGGRGGELVGRGSCAVILWCSCVCCV